VSKKPNEAITSKKLYPEAENLAKQYIDDFAKALIHHAKTLAFRERAEGVINTHPTC
jgi:hypothetical protein